MLPNLMSVPCSNPECRSTLKGTKFKEHPHHSYCYTQRCPKCKKKTYIKADGSPYDL